VSHFARLPAPDHSPHGLPCNWDHRCMSTLGLLIEIGPC
jgi:hypothetical protein